MAINMDLIGPREGEAGAGAVAGAVAGAGAEADGDFGIVTESQVKSWQKKLNERFGIGSGKLRTF